MFKRITLFAVLLAAVGFTANAQWLNFQDNNRRLTLGLNLGVAGFGAGTSPAPEWGKSYAGFGFGGSLSVYGVYLDCLINGPEYQYDKHVREADVPDQRAFTINLGYQIPILPWLRIAPILGYSQTSYGYTDYSSVNIEVDSETSTGRIYHDYNAVKYNDEFNFGGAIFVQPIKYLELGFVGTRRAIYGGIILNLSALAEDKE